MSSTAGTLGAGPAGHCTLRDALVVADTASNAALTGPAEPNGGLAARDCSGETSGSGSPYTVVLAAGATYTLDQVDNHWFGPDGLPPISDNVTIEGNGAAIARSSAFGTPAFRFFYVSGGLSGPPGGTLTLDDLALSNGLAQGGGSKEGGGGAGMGGAIFDQGTLALERVTLSRNEALGGSPNATSAGSGGGGIGADSPVGGVGGGFGGPVPPPGADLGPGGAGAGASSGTGGGGGGFRSADVGGNGGPIGSPGGGGGLGGFGDNSSDDGGSGGDSDGGGAGGNGGRGGAGGGAGDGGGGGGVGGGGGATNGAYVGGAGGFGGGGGVGGVMGAGGFGGFGGGGGGCANGGGLGGFGGGAGSASSVQNGGGGAGMGGAVFSLFGQVSVFDSTLSGNSAVGGPAGTLGGAPHGGAGDGLGGAVFNVDGSLSVNGSTVSANTASGGSSQGGGVYSLAFGNTITSGSPTTATVSFAGSILYGNSGGGLYVNQVPGNATNTSTSVVVRPSIIGSTNTAGGATATGSPITSNPVLGSLQNNGGTLDTMKPGAGSPAIGAGTSCDTTDELGAPRPTNGCDLGALELTAALAPTASTSAATAVSQTGATLNGQVDPMNDQTSYQFELSTDPSFGSFASLPSAAGNAGAGATTVPVSATATGLLPRTVYYYRLVATDNSGSATSSPAEMFSTLPLAPAVSTSAPSGVSLTGAMLNGEVDPKGAGTTYQFDLSASPSFSTFSPWPFAPSSVGAGTTAVSATATGLSANTVYYYRLTATNGGGTSTSAPAQVFATLTSITKQLGDRRLTVVTVSSKACTASAALPVSLSWKRHGKGAKVKLVSVAIYIDKGVKHTHRKTVHTRSGKVKKERVTEYVANATVKHLPVSLELSLSRLKPDLHTLIVQITYRQTKTKHGHKTTVTRTKKLKTKIVVC